MTPKYVMYDTENGKDVNSTLRTAEEVSEFVGRFSNEERQEHTDNGIIFVNVEDDTDIIEFSS